MDTKRLHQIQKEIQKIKKELQKIGPMRSGSLTRQYKDPQKKTGAFWQLSYTHRMKSKTQYIRPEFINIVKGQIATYKRFKKLVERWVNLALEYTQTKMKIDKKKKSG